MRRSGIYRIELGNGYFYIGSSTDIPRREKHHCRELKRGKHRNIKMQNCWNKYGVFVFTVLEECEIPKLLLLEQFHIDKYFYNTKNVNINQIAGSSLGYKHSAEVRAKMSSLQIGRVHSAKSRANMSAAHKFRKPKSAETRAKLSVAHRGKVFSAEHCANISAALTGQVPSSVARANMSAAQKHRRKQEQLSMEEMGYGKKCS